MTRVLIFTATVGEGHDLPARTLADQLREESPDSEIVTEDGLRAMGRGFVLVNEKAAGVVFFRLGLQWLWDATFWLCVGFAPTRRLTQAAVHAFGSRGVLRLVRHVRPDVIVSVYPDDDRGARQAAPDGSASTSRSWLRSPTWRRCTTGPRRGSTCTS